jgi:hypothetical protein
MRVNADLLLYEAERSAGLAGKAGEVNRRGAKKSKVTEPKNYFVRFSS